MINGSTKAQGRNYSVEEMKERFDTLQELEYLRGIEKKYNRNRDRTRSR